MHADTRLVLASGSPRRRRLLELIGLPHRICPADIEERLEPGEEPARFALRAAGDKARAVAQRVLGSPVLGADTVVEIDGAALGKPESPQHAAEMLRRLSGRSHQVHTGVALVLGERCEALVDTTDVRFRSLSDGMIDWYVATGEPLDKAGAYAVQGRGGVLVEAIDGSPHTVVGLPIHRLPELFAAIGLDFWAALVADSN